MIKHTTTSSEYRELKASFEALQKDVIKKESRIESLMKDLISVRTSASNYQKEYRSLVGRCERVVLEKQQLEKQLDEVKQYCNKLELHAASLEEASVLSELNRIQKIQIDNLKNEVQNKENLLDAREQRLTTLDYDLACLRNSIEVQKHYEGNVKGGLQSGREMMRTLYCDLSKNQTDLQKRTLALAQCTDELKTAKDHIAELAEKINGLENTVSTLNRENEVIIEENGRLKDIIAKNTAQVSALKEAQGNFQGQVEDLARRLSESRYEQDRGKEHAQEVQEGLEEENSKLRQDNTTLTMSVEHLEGLLAQRDTLHMVTEKKLQSEWQKLNEQKVLYAETLQKNEILESQLALFKSTYTESMASKEESIRELNVQLTNSKAREMELQVRYNEIRGVSEQSENMIANIEHQLSGMILQRDEAVEALQQCMLQYKTINRQYLNERSMRLNAEEKSRVYEKDIGDLKASKEYALNAVLDALQQEKDKVSKLERLLGDSSTASYYYEKARAGTGDEINSSNRSVSISAPASVSASASARAAKYLPAPAPAPAPASTAVTTTADSSRHSPSHSSSVSPSRLTKTSPPAATPLLAMSTALTDSPAADRNNGSNNASTGTGTSLAAEVTQLFDASSPERLSRAGSGLSSTSVDSHISSSGSTSGNMRQQQHQLSTATSSRNSGSGSSTSPDSMQRVSDNIARLKQQFDSIVTSASSNGSSSSGAVGYDDDDAEFADSIPVGEDGDEDSGGIDVAEASGEKADTDANTNVNADVDITSIEF